jgi:hypothetical protein
MADPLESTIWRGVHPPASWDHCRTITRTAQQLDLGTAASSARRAKACTPPGRTAGEPSPSWATAVVNRSVCSRGGVTLSGVFIDALAGGRPPLSELHQRILRHDTLVGNGKGSGGRRLSGAARMRRGVGALPGQIRAGAAAPEFGTTDGFVLLTQLMSTVPAQKPDQHNKRDIERKPPGYQE